MKLYGYAFAAVPEEVNGQIFKITGTPVSIENGDRENVITEPGAYKNVVLDTRDMRALMDFFIPLVNQLETLEKAQRESLVNVGLGYKPLTIRAGQDSNKPVHLNNFFVPLFNCVVNGEESEEMKRNSLSRRARKAFFKSNTQTFEQFKNACTSLSRMMPDMFFHRGSFFAEEPAIPLLPENQEYIRRVNFRLLTLKAAFDRNEPGALEQLIEKGRQMGAKFADELENKPTAFAVAAPFDVRDPKVCRQNPYMFFHEWHPLINKAFRKALNAERFPAYRYIKMPSDPRRPHFVDPTADGICHIFESIMGQRKLEDAFDQPDVRAEIAKVTHICSQETLAL